MAALGIIAVAAAAGMADIIIFMTLAAALMLRRQAVAVRYLTATPMSAAMSIITIIIHSRHVRRQCRTVAVIPQPIMMIAPIGCSSYVIS